LHIALHFKVFISQFTEAAPRITPIYQRWFSNLPKMINLSTKDGPPIYQRWSFYWPTKDDPPVYQRWSTNLPKMIHQSTKDDPLIYQRCFTKSTKDDPLIYQRWSTNLPKITHWSTRDDLPIYQRWSIDLPKMIHRSTKDDPPIYQKWSTNLPNIYVTLARLSILKSHPWKGIPNWHIKDHFFLYVFFKSNWLMPGWFQNHIFKMYL